MSKSQWLILGATSVIAQEFAHLAAGAKHSLLLVGRDKKQLEIIATDLSLRHQVSCEILEQDLSGDIHLLLHLLKTGRKELSLFIGHSEMKDNKSISSSQINSLLQTNVINTIQIIHAYQHRHQKKHPLIFLSSAAAGRGRAKNSLYGCSKAAVEVYLQGLQQAAGNQAITIARLGFIDTRQTYGVPGVFYAASPKKCATACWKAVQRNKNCIYFPFFWRFIMAVVRNMPFFIYKRMKW